MLLTSALLTIIGLSSHARAQAGFVKVSFEAEFVVHNFSLHDSRRGIFILWPRPEKNIVITDQADTNFRVKFDLGLGPECESHKHVGIGRRIECSLQPFRLLTAEGAPLPKFPARMPTSCDLAIPSHRELISLTIQMHRVFRDIRGNILLDDDEVKVRQCLRPIPLRWGSFLLTTLCPLLILVACIALCIRTLYHRNSCCRKTSQKTFHKPVRSGVTGTDGKALWQKAPLVSSDITHL